MSLPRDDERGAMAVEAAFLVPVLLLMCLMIVGSWRLNWASTQLGSATAAAARAAAAASTPDDAMRAAGRVLTGDLADAGIRCANADIVQAGSGFDGAGKARIVTRCVVPLSDLLIAGFPASVTLTAAATETVETFQERPS